ncbi:MAG: hypothetical protein AAF532_02560 [Planctomycetota bacterium]
MRRHSIRLFSPAGLLLFLTAFPSAARGEAPLSVVAIVPSPEVDAGISVVDGAVVSLNATDDGKRKKVPYARIRKVVERSDGGVDLEVWVFADHVPRLEKLLQGGVRVASARNRPDAAFPGPPDQKKTKRPPVRTPAAETPKPVPYTPAVPPDVRLRKLLSGVPRGQAGESPAAGVEIDANYIRDRVPADDAWGPIKNSEANWQWRAVFRVFHEGDCFSENLTVTATNATVAVVDAEEGSLGGLGQFAAVPSGSFVAVVGPPNRPVSVTVASLCHMPAVMSLPADGPPDAVGGDVMLRRPAEADKAHLVVLLQNERGGAVKDWHLWAGPVTFGGPYGSKVSIGGDGLTAFYNVAPQTLRIGFDQRMRAADRSSVTLRPGRTTFVTYRLGPNEKLGKPTVTVVGGTAKTDAAPGSLVKVTAD